MLGAGLLASSACSERKPTPFEEPYIDLFSVDGWVAGVIRNASGTAVGYADVQAFAGSDAYPRVAWSLTNPDGRYLIRIQGMNESDKRLALRLSVSPPSGSCLAARDTTGLTVLLTREYPSPDTTFVDLVLATDTGKCAA